MFMDTSEYSALAEKIGMIIIPGLGQYKRLKNVYKNVKVLEKSMLDNWDCIIYLYSSPSSIEYDELWSKGQKEMKFISSLCTIKSSPNNHITDNLFQWNLTLNSKYKYDFILLDDVSLYVHPFRLNKFLHIMTHNNCTISSPRVIGSTKYGGGGRLFMNEKALYGTAGYVVKFIEMYAWIMTNAAYRALWELLVPEINRHGWGYDYWYDGYAKTRVLGHKMCMISPIVTKHMVQNRSLNADNTTGLVKMRGLRDQERFFLLNRSVDLFAKSVEDKSQTTWVGDLRWLGPVSSHYYGLLEFPDS